VVVVGDLERGRGAVAVGRGFAFRETDEGGGCVLGGREGERVARDGDVEGANWGDGNAGVSGLGDEEGGFEQGF